MYPLLKFAPYVIMKSKDAGFMTSRKIGQIISDDYLKYYFDIPYEGKTSAGKPLKKLRNITCPYRGIKIIPSEEIKGFEKGLAKCTTAIDYVELLSKFSNNMLPTEKVIYAIFKDFVKLNPNDDLQNCLMMIKNNCLTRLKLEELEVLDDVDKLTKKLSPYTALEVRARTTKCREVILTDCMQGSFKRKMFLQSLEEILPKENEKEILTEIRNKALFLPTSESSRNAFVAKYSHRSQQEIVRRLFISSTASIEHIIPASNGGLNSMGNFLLASASGNRYRENMPLSVYIKRHPKIPVYMQMYINDIIEEIHNGKLEGNETYPYKIKKKLYEESDGKIILSLSNYRYSEEESIRLVEQYDNRWKIKH